MCNVIYPDREDYANEGDKFIVYIFEQGVGPYRKSF